MKILSFLTILLSISNTFTQWSTDPNNNLVVAVGWDPHIASDSAGGCYITYNYGSFYPQKLAVERLDKYGYKPWATRRQILGELPEQWQAKIIEDGEGGVIVSYQDNLVVGANYITRVRVQKVDSNGNFLWGQTGVRVTTTELTQGDQAIVGDGNGGCVVVWTNRLPNVTYEFRANRINNLGERVWSDTGIYLGNNINSNPSIIIRASDGNYYVQVSTTIYRVNQNGEILNQYYSPTLGQPVPDPEGGLVLSGIVGNINNRRLVAQRKDSLGNNLWQDPYVEIADSLGLGSFRIGVNNRIINFAWLGRYDSRPYFQAINLEGNLIYQNKILLSNDPSGTTFIGIISSYYNNAIFSWSISGEINSIFAQMYDTLGNKLWNENGIIVAHPRMTYQQYITDGRGGFIIAGLINNFTVVAQQVSKNGYLGEIITNVNADHNNLIDSELSLGQNFPNPFNSNSRIYYTVPSDGNILIELFNTLGERVKTILNGFHYKGTYLINISSTGLSSGIYLYKLQFENKSLTKKLIIIK